MMVLIWAHNRRMIEKNDIPNIISLVKEYISCVETESVDTFSDKYGLSVLASKEEIAENDYVLVGDRYKNNLPLDCEYEMVQLGDTRYFCLESGGTPNSNKAEYWDGDINWVTLVDIPDTDKVTLIKETGRTITSLGLKNSSAKLLPANSILVSSRATIGRVAISKVELATNQGFKNIVIKDFSKVDPYYIALMLSVQKDKLSNMATGGTFKEFSKRALENFQIPLPPIEIQKQIVAEIESYQKIIDGAKLVVGNYKPTYSCGGINCEKKTIKDVVVFNPAKTEVKDFVGDVSFVPMSEVQEHSIHFECKGTKKINEVYIGYTYFRESDVLIAKVTPCFENGKSGIARNLTNGIGFGSSEFFVLRAYNEIILPELIYCVISSNEFISQGKEHMTGTGGLKRLNKNFVLNYPIFVPPMEEQKLIVQRIQQEYEIVEANKKLISIFEQKIKDKLSEVWGE